MKINRLFYIIFAVLSAFLTVQCAKVGSPTGGEKDENPPVILSTSPENGTVRFQDDKIEIKFDELIKFKDLKKQLVISPPMKNELIIKPQVGVADRIRIKIQDTLVDNTTYSINFGNSIEDNNEGNPIYNYKYVFSTGDYIDSLFFGGRVMNALELEALEDVTVGLYSIDSSYTDSVVFNGLPSYLNNTVASDTFKIENIKPGKYRVVALLEKTRNYKYDPGQDKIGFLDQVITLPDTNNYFIYLFEEENVFNLKRPIHQKQGEVLFDFGKYSSDLKIERVFPERSDSLIDMFVYSVTKDSLSYWFNHQESDSLQFRIVSEKNKLDSVVNINLKKQKDLESSFKITNQNILNPDLRLGILSNVPIIKVNPDSVMVMSLSDSVYLDFKIVKKTDFSYEFDLVPKYEEKYKIEIYPGAFENLFAVKNDTIIGNSRVKSKSDYSLIELDLKGNVSFPVIVQLLPEGKTNVVQSITLDKAGSKAEFKHLKPIKYNLRLIVDANKNGKWDTGNFLKGVQPEEVIYYDEVFELKSNWEVQQTWILN
jgi:uncharacterized protein (DUF2141 family)